MLCPPCLSGVSVVQSIPVDVCAVAVIDASCYKKMCQRDSLWHGRETQKERFEFYMLRPMKYLQCQHDFACSSIAVNYIQTMLCISSEVLAVKCT